VRERVVHPGDGAFEDSFAIVASRRYVCPPLHEQLANADVIKSEEKRGIATAHKGLQKSKCNRNSE
jgi:hypothetical protein